MKSRYIIVLYVMPLYGFFMYSKKESRMPSKIHSLIPAIAIIYIRGVHFFAKV